MAGNHNSGMRPKPTSLKVLQGNPGKRQLNLNEPKPPEGEAPKPKGLSVEAGVVWDELAPICLYMGTLTMADLRPFARLCELEATACAASKRKDEPGFELITAEGRVHSTIKIERETSTALRPFYEYFGLTPSARARIQVPKRDDPVSKWAGVLK